MRAIRNAYVDLPEGQVHIRVADGCEPTILFLHQTASSSLFYMPLFQTLNLPNRLVAIDLPGFGGSFDPLGEPNMLWYANQISAVADGIGARQFVVYGHHTGTSIAMELAARYPERLAAILLCGAVFMTDEERAEFRLSHGSPIPLDREGRYLQTNWDYAANYNLDCPLELLHQEVVSMLRARIGRSQAYLAVAGHDAQSIAPQIKAPVLIISSPEDYFHAALDRAKSALPHAEVALVGGMNFQAALDPEGTARSIEIFLRDQI